MKKVTIKYRSARTDANGNTVAEHRTYTFEATEERLEMLKYDLHEKRGPRLHSLVSALVFIEATAGRYYLYDDVSIAKIEEGGNDG